MDLAIPVGWRQFLTAAAPAKDADRKAEIPSFEKMIQDAQLLLSHAVTAGAVLNDADVKILNDEIQKAAADNSGSHNYADALLAYSRIAKQLLPITAYTLRECFVRSHQTIRSYARWSAVFVILIVSVSLVTFVSSTISDSMRTEIDLANSKAITLQAHLGPPPVPGPSPSQAVEAPQNSGQLTYSYQDKLIDLQQLAISSRYIYGRAQNLRWLIIPAIPDPFPADTEELRTKSEKKPIAKQNFAPNLNSTLQNLFVIILIGLSVPTKR